jgi:hypothetical protein
LLHLQEEKQMDGAPEGELFDVVVRNDNELVSFLDKPEEELDEIYKNAVTKSVAENATWADKYELVELIRSISFTRPSYLAEKSLADAALVAAIESTASLRSTEIRNGMHAINTLLHNCTGSLNEDCIGHAVSLLIGKSVSGPKFICSMSSQILSNVCLHLSPDVAARALLPQTQHKNADACSTAVGLLADTVVGRLSKDNQDHVSLCRPLIISFSVGLTSKRSAAASSSKTALLYLRKEYFGDEIFLKYLEDVAELDESKKAEIARLTPFVQQPVKPANSFSIRDRIAAHSKQTHGQVVNLSAESSNTMQKPVSVFQGMRSATTQSSEQKQPASTCDKFEVLF